MNKPFNYLLAALLLVLPVVAGAEDDTGKQLQQQFDTRYKNYMGTDAQSLLPFPTLEKQDWEKLRSTHTLKKIFVEPDVFYNAKSYTFTLFQAEDGNYYLDAKGGFWGMDELFYGPIGPSALQ